MTDMLAAARAAGMINLDALVIACARHGLPLYYGLAILEKETRGQNVFGHDSGGAMYGAGEVTEAKYRQFRRLIDSGKTSNGVGPMQITWKGHFPRMDALGLRPWVPEDNIEYGIRVLAASVDTYREQSFSLEKAFWWSAKDYNGNSTYADDVARKAGVWKRYDLVPLISVSLRAIQSGIRDGKIHVKGGEDYQRALNRFTGMNLTLDGVLGRNTRIATAYAQLVVARRNGSRLGAGDMWPARGFNSDLDGVVGAETLSAIGLNNSDSKES